MTKYKVTYHKNYDMRAWENLDPICPRQTCIVDTRKKDEIPQLLRSIFGVDVDIDKIEVEK